MKPFNVQPYNMLHFSIDDNNNKIEPHKSLKIQSDGT